MKVTKDAINPPINKENELKAKVIFISFLYVLIPPVKKSAIESAEIEEKSPIKINTNPSINNTSSKLLYDVIFVINKATIDNTINQIKAKTRDLINNFILLFFINTPLFIKIIFYIIKEPNIYN